MTLVIFQLECYHAMIKTEVEDDASILTVYEALCQF